MSNKISSRWAISYENMSEKDVDYILRSKLTSTIVYKITEGFINKYPQFEFMHIYNICMEAYWKAMKSFNPERGNFTNHATFVCRAYITRYIKTKNKEKMNEYNFQCIDDSSEPIYSIENKLNTKVTLDKILEKVSEQNRKILIAYYFYYNNKTELIKYLGMRGKDCRKNKRILNEKIEAALAEAREVVNANN